MRAGGPAGLYSVSGIKYTVARRVAEDVLRCLADAGLGRPYSRPDDTPPPTAVMPDLTSMQSMVAESPEAAQELVRTIVQTEAVQSPEDLLFRRTDWGPLLNSEDPLVALVSDLAPSGRRRGAE